MDKREYSLTEPVFVGLIFCLVVCLVFEFTWFLFGWLTDTLHRLYVMYKNRSENNSDVSVDDFEDLTDDFEGSTDNFEGSTDNFEDPWDVESSVEFSDSTPEARDTQDSSQVTRQDIPLLVLPPSKETPLKELRKYAKILKAKSASKLTKRQCLNLFYGEFV